MKMFVDPGAIHLRREPVDFRKSINGLVPFDYLRHILQAISEDPAQIDRLLGC